MTNAILYFLASVGAATIAATTGIIWFGVRAARRKKGH